MKAATPMSLRRAAGFTLTELLIVISIIVVLVAILVPVVSKVRIAAQNANTQAQLQRINAAITNYFHDFQAYPGMAPNSAFDRTKGLSADQQWMFTDPSAKRAEHTLTQSEDLALALLGGVGFGGTPPTLQFAVDKVGKGPVTANPRQPTQKQAYIQLKDSDITVRDGSYYVYQMDAQSWMVPNPTVKPPPAGVQTDSAAPEFVDQFNDPRPIIYVRANLSVPVLANNSHVLGHQGQGVSLARAYNYDSFAMYMKKPNHFAPPNEAKADFYFKTTSSEPASEMTKRVQQYFTGPSVQTPRNANGYMLFSAGPDRQFGTADDIIFGSGGGQ